MESVSQSVSGVSTDFSNEDDEDDEYGDEEKEKLKLPKKWKGVMACDVSPVAMFSKNAYRRLATIGKKLRG